MENQSLDIWSLLIIIGLAQGFFVLSLMVFKGQVKRQNMWLFGLLIIIIWFQAEFLSIRYPLDVGVSIFYGTRYGSWLILGPFYLFYIWSATGRSISLKQVVTHVIPFIVLGIAIPLIMGGILNFRQVHYGMLTPLDPFNEEVSYLQYFYTSVFALQFFHFLVYLIVASRHLRNQEIRLKQVYSNYENESYRWLRISNVSMYLVLFFATAFLVLLFFTRIYRRHMDYIYVLPMSLLVYLVSYKLSGVKWSKSPPASLEPKKYLKSALKPEELRVLKSRLLGYFNDERPYLNNDLRLQDLADGLDIPTHHLSQLLNLGMSTTFFDFVNRKRVEAAKEFIKNDPNASLLEITFKCGFNNKTSFVNAFKKYANMTPSSYRQQFIPA